MKVVIASLVASLVLLLVLAGVLLYTPASHPVDCKSLPTREERKDCLTALGGADADADAMRAAIDAGRTAWDRDLVRLQYVSDDPQLARTLCPEVEGDEARTLCLRVQGRSHLWRSEGGGHRKGHGKRQP